ncbi:uncharacterized protein LOC133702746 [Populus nigra]|uniref:uncharacterized protein LOC133702746 n=1 Tax=Populus nigra TaxID=3691 RepID=UPI002B273008|nr:uncharacterized protein LOC133702746 [Populus nigra]
MSSHDGSTPGSDPSTAQSSQPSISMSSGSRGRMDLAWGHCREALELSVGCKKTKLVCLYCAKVFAGGGINRFKQHLARAKGEVEQCRKCPPDVRHQMLLNLKGNAETKKRVREMQAEFNPFNARQRKHEEMMIRQLEDDDGDDEDDEDVSTKKHMLPLKVAKKKKIQSTSTVKQSTTSCGKQKKSATLGIYFMPRTTPGAQKSIQNCWQRKEAVERCDLALAKWMIDACVPFNAVNSVYYQHAIDAVTAMGSGYKGPNLHAIRGYYLAKAVDEVKIYVETYREIWKKTDVSDVSNTARLLYQLFREVVLYVGVENIVYMVTDNAANYVAAGKLLMEEFPSIFWSPCAAYCINLILQDIGKLQSVCCVVEHASGITNYIYNHCYPLYLMRKFTGGKEILRPAPTRFATNFIALQSILAHEDELRAMVTSREWVSSAYAKDSKGKKFVESVLDSLFWEKCAIIVRMSEPLIRVLRIVDGDDRPLMRYLYDVIHHAKEEMMRRFQKRKARVKPFINIISNRWDEQFYRHLYVAAFWLNPRFQYDANIMDKHMSTISGLLDVLEKYAHGNLPLQSKITGEMKLFRNVDHDFGRVSAINNRTLMPPVSKEHADDLLGVDEIGSIPSTFDPNFASMDTEELNVFIQQK